MRREKVLEVIRELGPCTTGELVTIILGITPDQCEWKYQRNVVSYNLRLLRKDGLVRLIGERKVKYGKENIWEAVE